MFIFPHFRKSGFPYFSVILFCLLSTVFPLSLLPKPQQLCIEHLRLELSVLLAQCLSTISTTTEKKLS